MDYFDNESYQCMNHVLLYVKIKRGIAYWLMKILNLCMLFIFILISLATIYSDCSITYRGVVVAYMNLFIVLPFIYILILLPSGVDIKIYNDKILINQINYEIKNIDVCIYGSRVKVMEISYLGKLFINSFLSFIQYRLMDNLLWGTIW